MLLFLVVVSASAFEPHFMKDPDISPDGKEVCFSYNGDLWKVPFDGGVAVRLTDTVADEFEPKYSPDGKSIAFMANREGSTYIYQMDVDGGAAIVLSDGGFGMVDWYSDSKSLVGTKYNNRTGRGFYKINFDGKRPEEITLVGDSFASLSKDGQSIVYNDRGHPYRESYTGSTNGELWRYDIKDDTYVRLTETDVTERYPTYSKTKNNRLYYAKSDGEVFQLYKTDNYDFTKEEKLTNFSTWSVRDLSIARDNDRLVFEKFDEIWVYDTKVKFGNKAKKLNIEIREEIQTASVVRKNLVNSFDDFEVSPNDKFIIFTYEYDLFMMPTAGGPVKQITKNHIPIGRIVILNDNKTVVFSAREKGLGQLYKFQIDNIDNITKIAWSEDRVINNFYSLETGEYFIDYVVNGKQGRTAISDSLFQSFEPLEFAKSDISEYTPRKNSHIVAYTEYDITKGVSYLYLRDTKKGKSYKVTDSYRYISQLIWGKDDKSLFFSMNGSLKRLDLYAADALKDYNDPWLEVFPKEEVEEDEEETVVPEAKEDYPELRLNLVDLEKRIKTIVDGFGRYAVVSVKNDTTLFYIDNSDDSISSCNYDGKNSKLIKKIENKSYFSFNKNSNTYYYNDGEKISSVNLNTQATSSVGNSFFYEYDRDDIRAQVFREVWGRFGSSFYDPEMHGVNWDKLYKKYEKYIQFCDRESVLENIIDEMIGEVNASHTGFYPKRYASNFYYKSGSLGIEFDYSKTLKKGIKFKRLYDGTVLKDAYDVQPGDLLLAINDQPINEKTIVSHLLRNTEGKKVKLTIKKLDEDSQDVWVEPFGWAKNSNLEYKDWVNQRAKIVEEDSNQKLAYLHIKGMNYTAYQKFLEEFWSDNLNKDGFIIDVRGNGGGNISQDLISVIQQRPQGIESVRYYGAKKFSTPKRFFEKPIVVLIDKDSFSDAEIFPHLMKDLKLATIIGMPTSGSVIGTNDITLFDGSKLRIPRNGWWLLDGTNMEGNGAQPDIRIEMSPEDRINDNDVQLEKAIDFLLNR